MKYLKPILVVLLALIVLAAPPVFRLVYHDNLLIGEEPYYHARIAQQISEDTDTLIYDERIIQPTLYHYMLFASSNIVGIENASRLLPLLFGVLSVVLFYFLLRKLGVDKEKTFIISLLLVISPAFIYTFVFSTPHALSVLIILLGMFLISFRKTTCTVIAFVLFASLLFFNTFSILLALVILGALVINKGKEKLLFLFFMMALLVASLFYFISLNKPFVEFSSDLGALIGFGIFTLVLSVLGLLVTWDQRSKLLVIYSPLIFLSAAVFFFGSFVHIYLNFFLAILVGYGISYILKRKWRVTLIRNLTLVILICGLVFSAVSYTARISGAEPDSNIVDSLQWLNSQEHGTVLSHHSNGFWIQNIAGKKVITDGLTGRSERIIDSDSIFASRTLDNTKELLNKYDVKYIWIDNAMKKGEVWRKDKEGLLFLFRNNETFSRGYSNNNIEIWYYLT
ncbi:MAG: hypothetical protein GY861_08575 [bacterium]|nr:hypothetical protein [bacterium]